MLYDHLRRAGTWLAGLAGAAVAYLVADPVTTRALIDLLPEGPSRVLAGAGLGILVTVVASSTNARDVKKAKKPE